MFKLTGYIFIITGIPKQNNRKDKNFHSIKNVFSGEIFKWIVNKNDYKFLRE